MRADANAELVVEQAVRACGVPARGDRALVGVSGGQDSTALALVLWELGEALGVYLELGHVNHGLRGAESDGDEEFVQSLAERLGLPCRVARLGLAEGGEGGTEEGARRGRLSALRDMATAAGLGVIALGHTATDRAETVLMNVLRGTGLDGLAAMRARSGDLVRPLLGVTRADTAAYCAAKGVVPRYDSSNDDQSILRNRVRLSLMPLLEREYQPGVERCLVRLGEIAEAEAEWTTQAVEETYAALAGRQGRRVTLGRRELSALPRGLRWRLLRRAVVDVRGDLRNVAFDHLRALDDLLTDGQTGHRAEVPGVVAERRAASLLLRPAEVERRASFSVSLPVPGRVEVEEAGLEVCASVRPRELPDPVPCGPWMAQLDAAAVGGHLVVRTARPGDRFVPLGMSGHKKLQDFLVDKKIPRAEREGIPVIATTEGEIVWVVGHRVADTAKVTGGTRTVAEVSVRPLAP